MSELIANKKDLFDIILDPDNTENIIITNSCGKEITFEQIAVIPYCDGRRIYCVLKPLCKIDGVGDDEVLIFRLSRRNGKGVITEESNLKLAMEVFDKYRTLWKTEYLESRRKARH